ncbi:MAG: carbohydrate ABC transporter permease [Spirochaetota bacterium]
MVTRTRGDKIFDTVNLVLLLLFLFVIIYPLYFVLVASLTDPRLIYDNPILLLPRGFTLESYRTVFNNQDIWTGYGNTLLYTSLGTVINIVFTILAAYPLSRSDLAGRGPLSLIIVFTMFFNGGLIPTYLVIRNLGMLNTIWAMVVPNAINVYNMVIMRTYFQTRIPGELNDSARIDGCSNLQTLARIVLPLSTPIIAVMVLFYSVWHWNSYFDALIYLSDRDRFPLQLFLREILVQSEVESMLTLAMDEGYGRRMVMREGLKYAVVVVSSLPMLILYPLLQRSFKAGILVGALKG